MILSPLRATSFTSFVGPILGGIIVAMISTRGHFQVFKAGRHIVSFSFFVTPSRQEWRGSLANNEGYGLA
jgi:hypothetical protein